MRRYGIPYKGSKQAIADWVVDHLPPANTLVDLFCGGCTVTHAAMLSGKWENFIANDIQPLAPQLFVDSIHGKYTTTNEKRWISREDFFKLKDSDPYVKYCWSFGNDGATYMYGAEIEPLKKRLHELVFAETVHDRITAWRAFAREYNRSSLQSLERLESLQSLQRLEISSKDYRELPIPLDSVIYCDIPYNCTANNYGVKFDYGAFFEWVCYQYVPVIISEYNIPDDRFTELASIEKIQISQGAAHQKKVQERLYVPKWQLEEIRAKLQTQTQMEL